MCVCVWTEPVLHSDATDAIRAFSGTQERAVTSGTDVAHGEAHRGTTTLHHGMNILDSSLLYSSAKTRARLAEEPLNLILNFVDVLINLLKEGRWWGAERERQKRGRDAVLACKKKTGARGNCLNSSPYLHNSGRNYDKFAPGACDRASPPPDPTWGFNRWASPCPRVPILSRTTVTSDGKSFP